MSLTTVPHPPLPWRLAPGTLAIVLPRDTELADRLLQQRVKARLFGEAVAPLQIGAYALIARLGAGGMGVVYRAHDPELDRSVALKIMHPELTGAAERLRREARALARLAHPNVVSVFEIGDHAGQLYVAMELVEGVNLREWLASLGPLARPADLRARLDPFLQAARGLQAAHAVGLVHCDFKPENVLVGADGRVRVADFGIASQVGATARELTTTAPIALGLRTGDGELAGTPAYMAPEQLVGGTLDARTDQFAFCVALHEALAGDRPYPGDDLPALIASVTRGAPRSLPRSLPAGLRTLVARGLARDPAARFPDMAALGAALERVLRPAPVRTLLASAAALATVTIAYVAAAANPTPAAPPPPSLCDGSLAPATPEARKVAMRTISAEMQRHPKGSPEYLRLKTRALDLLFHDGFKDDACRITRDSLIADPPTDIAAELRCLQARHCAAAPITCPAGFTLAGPAGCEPTTRCEAAGVPAQVDACIGKDDAACCMSASIILEYEALEAKTAATPASKAERLRLASKGCTRGYAALCVEASRLDAAAAPWRRRACTLGDVAACAAPEPAKGAK